MSGEFEAAGAMATAGLAAGAIEGREAYGGGGGQCLNCQAALTGAYCSQCGQAARAHRTMSHLFEEVLHGLVHFDTKAWRTLPMLAFRPGTLTRNYIFGMRARYISPLALFLFTIFFMFFVFAFASPNALNVNAQSSGEQLEEARADLAEAEQELAQAVAAGPDRYTGDLDVRLARQAVVRAQAEVARREAEIELAQPEPNVEASAPAAPPEPSAPAEESGAASQLPSVGIRGDDELAAEFASGEERWQDAVAEAARNGEINVNLGSEAINQRVLHSLENPDLALYKVQNAAYKFSFLLVPISLPFIWLLFLWRRGHTLYDHAVFTLYSLSFASLVFVVVALTANVPWLEVIGGMVATVGLPVHMFFHLKGAYALGWWSAIWRTMFLLLFSVLSLTIFFVAIIVLGLSG